jgi:Ca-activated chloride channel family protein
VDQVVVYVSVYDKDTQLVSGLTQDEFTLFEDKLEQEITSFAQIDVPSTVGIVVDSSGSMRNKMTKVEEAMNIFLDQNNPENELFLVRFDDEVELEEDFTQEVEDIRDAIGNIIVRGGTALYDSIYLSIEKARKGNEPKRVIVVFTDGEDKDSYYTHEELLEKVRESEAQIYIVAFLDSELSDKKGFFGIFKSQKSKIEDQINAIADVTGGKAFFPKQVSELNPIFESIAHDLKNQYRLAYISANREKKGEWRRIDVKVDSAKERKLKVRAKKGYYAKSES